jgi:hypothetical protein
VKPITLGVPTATGGLLRVEVDAGDAKPYLTGGQLWVDYGDFDLTGVPPAVALLPALGLVIPVGVAAGVPVSSPVLDAVFAERVLAIAEQLREAYPHFAPAGFDLIGPVVSGSALFTKHDKAVLLYSGGLDSVTGLLRNWQDVECLLSVWGVEGTGEDDGMWRRYRTVIDAAPARPETWRFVARTNLRQLLDELRLNRRFDRGFPGADWWTSVHQGLGLTTLAAPLCSAFGLGRVIVTGVHGAGSRAPLGCSPQMHEQIRWVGTEVVHDAVDLDVQEKIARVIAPWMWQGGELMLAVCSQIDPEGISINCGTCEPCMRAVSAILVAGQDPAQAGLPVSAWSLMNWRDRLESGQVSLDVDTLAVWRMIQGAIQSHQVDDVYGAAGYLAWLGQIDLRRVARIRPRPNEAISGMGAMRYQAERAARHLPHPFRRHLRHPPGH